MTSYHAKIISEIKEDILSVEQNTGLCEEINFVSRTNTIDFIEFDIIDCIESLKQNAGQDETLDALKAQAEKLKCELEKIDINLLITFYIVPHSCKWLLRLLRINSKYFYSRSQSSHPIFTSTPSIGIMPE